MEVIKVSDKITLLRYPTQEELGKAFVRLQEHYESPQYKGKIFTLGEYRRWYADRFGAWTYYSDWSGFNMPGDNFKPFLDGLFDPLSAEETQLVELFRGKQGPFYVIGTSVGASADVLPHELCHALWATNKKYVMDVRAAIKASGISLKKIHKLLSETLGYHQSVIEDETQAYICASSDWLKEHGVDVPAELVQLLQFIKQGALPKTDLF